MRQWHGSEDALYGARAEESAGCIGIPTQCRSRQHPPSRRCRRSRNRSALASRSRLRAVITDEPEAHIAIVILTRLDLLAPDQVTCRDVEATVSCLHDGNR